MYSTESVIASAPVATLAALTPVTEEARLALGGQREVRVAQFPFKVGRESRMTLPANSAFPADQALVKPRLGTGPQLNDLYLIEQTWPNLLQISREHFVIEYADNQFFLIDRGSACGTIVAGKHVGGDRRGRRTALRSGDEIIVGSDDSPYVFRFEIVQPDQPGNEVRS